MQVYCFCVPFCWSHDKSHTGLTRRRASECRSRSGETHNYLPKGRSVPGLSLWPRDADMLQDILLPVPTNWDFINLWISSVGV